jgi:hypothetical protein
MRGSGTLGSDESRRDGRPRWGDIVVLRLFFHALWPGILPVSVESDQHAVEPRSNRCEWGQLDLYTSLGRTCSWSRIINKS